MRINAESEYAACRRPNSSCALATSKHAASTLQMTFGDADGRPDDRPAIASGLLKVAGAAAEV